MARRNLTVQLDEEVIRGAKIVAAKRGTSVSALVARELEEIVAEDGRYEDARRRALSFWDALIVEAAARSGATRLVTEDLQAGRRLAGVRIENPFG